MKKWMLWPAFMLVFPPVVVGGGAEEISMRLLKPAFVFQLCVRDTTEKEISNLDNYKGKSSDTSALEYKLWGAVIKECNTHLGDEQKGLMLLHYGGNSEKALGFYEGLVYSARAYVVSRALDVAGN